MECSTHGYTLHHVPRNSGRTGSGVGVLINDRVKLVARLEPIMQCHLRVWRLLLQSYLYIYD